MSTPSEAALCNAIELAAGQAIQELFATHPGQYYYLALITTGEAHPPVLSAWSVEALEAAVKDAADKVDARWGLKWSYADSPYFCFGQEHFELVNELFAKRPTLGSINSSEWVSEYETRLRAMETAMARLDQRGLFGTGPERCRLVVNVEVMPPDATNTSRAKRLNPAEALHPWLEEAAEVE